MPCVGLFRPELAVVVGVATLSLAVGPLSQDDYGSLVSALAAGQFSDFPLVDWYFLGYTGFAYLYCWLHSAVPQVNWIGGATYVMQLAGLFIGLRAVREALSPLVSHRWLWMILIALAVLYTDNLASVSYTRASLTLCGVSLLALITARTSTRPQTLLMYSVFLCGLFHRWESAVGALWLAGLSAPLLGLSFTCAARRIALPASFAMMFALGVYAYWHQSDSFAVRLEPDLEYEMMMGNVVPLSECPTAADSSIHVMAIHGMWFDMRTVTVEAMRALLRPSPPSPQRLQQAIVHLGQRMQAYLPIILWLVLCSAYAFFSSGARWLSAGIAVYVLLLMLPMAYFAYRGLLADRHLFPMLWLAAAVSVIAVARNCPNGPIIQRVRDAGMIFAPLMIALTVGRMLFSIADRNSNEADAVACSEIHMHQLEDSVKGRIIVLTAGTFRLMDRPFSLQTQNYDANTYVMYDLLNYSLVPRYVAYQSRLCGCDASDPVQFFTYLAVQNALYLAEPDRVAITAHHMQVVHGLPLRFAPAEDFPSDACLADHDSYLRDARLWRVSIGP